jgi:hypothetical protein
VAPADERMVVPSQLQQRFIDNEIPPSQAPILEKALCNEVIQHAQRITRANALWSLVAKIGWIGLGVADMIQS